MLDQHSYTPKAIYSGSLPQSGPGGDGIPHFEEGNNKDK